MVTQRRLRCSARNTASQNGWRNRWRSRHNMAIFRYRATRAEIQYERVSVLRYKFTSYLAMF